jgi:hypothetical protein
LRAFRQNSPAYTNAMVTAGKACPTKCFGYNGDAESFFGSFKQARIQWRSYQARHEARQDVLNYITMCYNSRLLHSHLGYKSQNKHEAEMAEMSKVA